MVANKCHPSSLSLHLFLNLLVGSLANANGAGIATYWGQNKAEGKLAKACASGNYDYINIAFLTTFGSGRAPVLDLSGHCNVTARGGCTSLGREIKACQKRGVKVMLSLGGDAGQQSLNSTEDAGHVAKDLYNNFLGGKAHSRPFGNAILDGIDFSMVSKAKKDRMHWEHLARALVKYNSPYRKVCLTAAAQCAYPDQTMGKALGTGLFDMAWIRFYDDASCRYSTDNLVPFKMAWEKWNARLRVSKVFIGLPASGEAAEDGYVPPRNFTEHVLPYISKFPKYGGIMLWDRYYDMENSYSDEVKYDIMTSDRKSST